jgi:hypothetical protein
MSGKTEDEEEKEWAEWHKRPVCGCMLCTCTMKVDKDGQPCSLCEEGKHATVIVGDSTTDEHPVVSKAAAQVLKHVTTNGTQLSGFKPTSATKPTTQYVNPYSNDYSKGGVVVSGKKEPSKWDCKHRMFPIVKIDGVNFYAGSTRGDSERLFHEEKTLVVSLCNTKPIITAGSARLKESPPEFEVLKGFFYDNKAVPIVIDWPDMGAPPFKRGFMKALFEEAKKQGFVDVLAFCIGGHGRTGTFYAALFIELLGYTYKEAVKRIHKEYCEFAIESKEQEEWLQVLAKQVKGNAPYNEEEEEKKGKS